jgi:hypothetical protein
MNGFNGWVRGTGLLALALAGCSDAEPTREPQAPPLPVATSLPPAMLGRWGQDGACSQLLEVTADRIDGARIDAISTAAQGAVDVDTSAEVEGITTGRRYRLASARGERLAVTVDGVTTARIRCP